MMVDDRWLSVGSANIANRSLRLNEEANLNILDEQLGAEHVEIFEEDKSHSREVTMSAWRRRPLREKIAATAGCLFRSQM